MIHNSPVNIFFLHRVNKDIMDYQDAKDLLGLMYVGARDYTSIHSDC